MTLLERLHHALSAKLVRETIGSASTTDEVRDGLAALHPDTLEARMADAVHLAEGALLGTEPRRAIWDDGDYLVAILATLTGDGMRARTAALTHAAREDK